MLDRKDPFALAFLTQTSLIHLPPGLYAFFGEDTAEWGKIMAASALTTLPTLILFLPLQTRLAAGLAQGAIETVAKVVRPAAAR